MTPVGVVAEEIIRELEKAVEIAAHGDLECLRDELQSAIRLWQRGDPLKRRRERCRAELKELKLVLKHARALRTAIFESGPSGDELDTDSPGGAWSHVELEDAFPGILRVSSPVETMLDAAFSGTAYEPASARFLKYLDKIISFTETEEINPLNNDSLRRVLNFNQQFIYLTLRPIFERHFLPVGKSTSGPFARFVAWFFEKAGRKRDGRMMREAERDGRKLGEREARDALTIGEVWLSEKSRSESVKNAVRKRLQK